MLLVLYKSFFTILSADYFSEEIILDLRLVLAYNLVACQGW
jgi:hypothetical protein